MRYAKKRNSDVDWQDELRAQDEKLRARRREAPIGAKLTRKMAKLDARLLAMAGREESDPMVTVKPPAAMQPVEAAPPPPKRALQPPPLPIPFPFPFANQAASGQMPVLVTGSFGSRDDSFMSVHDSWLLPTPPDGPARVSLRSLVPREPDPFTIVPPNFSLPPPR